MTQGSASIREYAACGRYQVASKLIACSTVIISMSMCAAADAQPVIRSWRETFQVDAPLLAAKRLENARGLIEHADWAQALAALTDLEEEFPDDLVQISQGQYINVALAVQSLRLQLPPEGREAYRQRIDGWAEQQFTTAVAARDNAALSQMLFAAFASSSGDDVLDRLAEWAWERGDIAAARRRWTQLVPAPARVPAPLLLRYPDADLEPAAVYARLILCSLAEGDLDRAGVELETFGEMFPEAQGSLAGGRGLLVDLLSELMESPDDWLKPAASQPWSTFARGGARNARSPRPASIGRPVWTMPLKPVYVPRWERPRVALPEQGLLARFPVTFGDGLFFHDGTTIHGLSLTNGKSLWPVESGESSTETPGKIYPSFPAITKSLPWIPIVGQPRFTSTIDAGRLYALLSPSILTLPPGGRVASPTGLVCLNLAEGEGRLEWFQAPEELFPEEWIVTGTPLADDGRLYVPLLRTEPQIEQGVACLRDADGALIWLLSIGQALRQPLGGRVELGHQLLTVAGDRLFLSTDLGAVASLDAATGRLAWVVTYAAEEREGIDRSDESVVGLLPPVEYEGVILTKPNDSNELMAIDSATGYVHWRQPVPGRIVHLLGVANATLIVSGDQLWAIDVDTGRPRWRFGYDDAAGYGYGRGVIAGDRVIWPTREELFLIDIKSGQLTQRLRLFESLGVGGGNLILAGDRLVIAGPNHLTAFAVQY